VHFASGVAVLALASALITLATAHPAGSQTVIVSVTAMPPPAQRNGGVLAPGKLNVVFSAGVVNFKVVLRNAGSSSQRDVSVVVVISRGTGVLPIVKTERFGTIRPGQTETVTFSHLGKVPFAMQSSLRVEVSGGHGPNNVYPVVFTSPD
jgi:hypothetical protein